MKSISASIFLAIAICLSSCQHIVQYPAELLIADSLCSCNPDSAMNYLEGLSSSMQINREPLQRYYQLLTIKAQDKAYITHTSDSLILDIVKYYEDGGNPKILPEAYYYAGRVYRDLGDAPQALDYFHKALDAFELPAFKRATKGKEHTSLLLKGKIFAQMGYLFKRQHLYDEAMNSLNEAYKIDSINKDTIGMLLSLRDIGNILHIQNKLSNAIINYEKAETLAQKINYKDVIFEVSFQKALIYSLLGDNKSALEIISQINHNAPNRIHSSYLAIIGRVFSNNEEYDKASNYYSLLLKSQDLLTRANANLWLGNRAIVSGNPTDAIEYIREYLNLEDSLTRQKKEESIALSQSLYNYQLKERQIHQYQIKDYKHKIYFWMSLCVAVILILIIFKQRVVRNKYKQQYEMLQGVVAASKKDVEIKQSLSFETLEELKQQELYNKLKQFCQEHIPIKNENWQDVEKMINAYYPDFIPKLRGIHNYNLTEWRLSLLLKIGFSWPEIALLIGRSYDAVYTSQARLLKKVFPKGSEYKKWSDFIAAI